MPAEMNGRVVDVVGERDLPQRLAAGLAGLARHQGGRIHAGVGSGVSRVLEYERLHGEGK
jgi:hypothetical protein